MLGFFRKHQRYFFLIITIVIVISFSFFGTYSTLTDGSFREQIAFRTVNGTDVTRHELDEMAAFIGTDALDKVLFAGMWGPNFLNDGVIRSDFLETGLGVILASTYADTLRPDLASRFEKEKRYALYVHPEARFISVESAWNYFAPGMASAYYQLRSAQDPLDVQALKARAALFLMEKKFPSPILHQVLRYQEKQNSYVNPDRALDRTDLSLFGYHTAEDWFGPRYIRLVSEFVINAAAIAEQKGYQVSKAEALADLMRNAEASFQQNARSPHLGVANSTEYFHEQLRRLGMDQSSAANVWRQVLLFRRLFQDMGSSVFVDPYTFKKLDGYALESVDGEIYRLPKALRLSNFSTLQKFETYLDAVAKRTEQEKTSLALPTTFLTPAQVAQKYPELVQKRYLLQVAQASKKTLESQVSLKETWNWEVSDAGWERLKKQFPELGTKKAASREERFATLDSLDDKTRGRVDGYARTAIVDAHPEAIEQALSSATPMTVPVGLHEKGGSVLFTGLKDGKTLMQLLDAAPLANEDISKANSAAKTAAEKLAKFTADNTVYFRITVLERTTEPEVLTFAEADQEGILTKLVDKSLEEQYAKIRDDNAKEFQKADKTWKPFADVKDAVAEKVYAKLLDTIRKAYTAAVGPDAAPQQMIPDYAATLRLYPYMAEVQGKLEKNPALMATLTVQPEQGKKEGAALAASKPLADQWKLERNAYQTTRSSGDSLLDPAKTFGLTVGAWTAVNAPANGDLNFFHVMKKNSGDTEEAIAAGVGQARALLSADAQQRLMVKVLAEIQAKEAISLDYLDRMREEAPEEE